MNEIYEITLQMNWDLIDLRDGIDNRVEKGSIIFSEYDIQEAELTNSIILITSQFFRVVLVWNVHFMGIYLIKKCQDYLKSMSGILDPSFLKIWG